MTKSSENTSIKRKSRVDDYDTLYQENKRSNIRYIIQTNHEKIITLLQRQAKTFLAVDWIRYQLRKEAEYLIRIPYTASKRSNKREWLDYTNIKNQENTYDYINSPEVKNTKIDSLEIIDIHRRLANGTKIIPGRYRVSNGVYLMGTGITAPDYNILDSIVSDIAFDLTNENSNKDFLSRALDFHFMLFATQPFDDFNKRTARMVMNWYLLQNDCEPIVFNRKQDYKNYAMALVARAQGDCRTYNKYMLHCLVRTQEDIIAILTNHAMCK